MSSSEEESDVNSVEEEEVAAPAAKTKKKRKTKKKKKKDPNAPKRPMSSFFLYSNANRARVKEENPDAKFGDVVSSFICWMFCVYVCVDDGHIIVWRALAFHVHLYFVSAVCMVMPQLVLIMAMAGRGLMAGYQPSFTNMTLPHRPTADLRLPLFT